jgi:hypothetical protein
MKKVNYRTHSMRHEKPLKWHLLKAQHSACIAFFMGSRATDTGFHEGNTPYFHFKGVT